MSSRPPGVVLWDADGVLQGAMPGWRERLIEVGGEEFLEALFAEESRCMTGKVPFVHVVARMIERFQLDVSASDVMTLWARIELDEEALALVDRVRSAGARCFLATNQHDYRRDVMRVQELYEGHLDGEFYSCELGAAKPDAAYFEAVLEAVGVPAADVLFIDDSPRNVDGARACGIRAELHDPRAGAAGLRRILESAGFDGL